MASRPGSGEIAAGGVFHVQRFALPLGLITLAQLCLGRCPPPVAALTSEHHPPPALDDLAERPQVPERVGYLLQERVFDIATVVDALRRIVDGETVIDPTIVSRLVGRRRRQDPLAVLSEREREVLGLIAEGMSNRAIAARLYVTERTVEAHTTQIFQKLRLPGSPDQHRRVLAVLAFLRA